MFKSVASPRKDAYIFGVYEKFYQTAEQSLIKLGCIFELAWYHIFFLWLLYNIFSNFGI
jgi:hypothetical protein